MTLIRYEGRQIETDGQRQRQRSGQRTRRQMQLRRRRRTRETAQDQKKTRSRRRSGRPDRARRRRRRQGGGGSARTQESGRKNASAIPRKRRKGGGMNDAKKPYPTTARVPMWRESPEPSTTSRTHGRTITGDKWRKGRRVTAGVPDLQRRPPDPETNKHPTTHIASRAYVSRFS